MGEDYGNAQYKEIAQFAKCLTINREDMDLYLAYIEVIMLHGFQFNKPMKAQQNPCPDIFEYIDDGANGYGIITIPSPGEGTTIVSVKLAIRGNIHRGYGEGLGLFKSLEATAADVRQNRNIQYRINFPRSNGFPFIISIVVNGDIEICSARIGGNLATWSFTHTFTYPSGNLKLSNPYRNRINPNKPTPTPKPPATSKPKPPVTPKPTPPATPRPAPRSTQPANDRNQPPRSSIPNDASWLSTYRYANECGRSIGVTHTVIGGSPVKEGEYPWLVALYKADRVNGQTTRKYICGGNLVSNKHVITAAHCIGSEQRLYMEFGKYDLSDFLEIGYEVRISDKILTHTEYRPNTGHADIAIITLQTAVTFTEKIRPICLWSFGSNTDAIEGIITGWGREEQGGPTADKPLQLAVEMVSQKQCDTDEQLRSISSSKTFCAGGKSKGPCHGDSGGGFYLARNNRWYLRGIISTSLGNNFVCDSLTLLRLMFLRTNDAAMPHLWNINKDIPIRCSSYQSVYKVVRMNRRHADSEVCKGG
ncbi:uncharacterized protein CBL_04062 [Carabus blaptoides fortunei]